MLAAISDRFTVLAVSSVLGVSSSRIIELEKGIKEFFPAFSISQLTDIVTGKSSGPLFPNDLLNTPEKKDDVRAVVVNLITELDPDGSLQVKIGEALLRYRADLFIGDDFESFADLLVDGVAPLLISEQSDKCECGSKLEEFNLSSGVIRLCPNCE